MVCSRKHHMQRVCFNTLLLDERMSEETGPRREACGIDSCQLKVSSFCSGTPLFVVQAPFWSYIHLRTRTVQSCTLNVVVRCLLGFSVSQRRVAHGPFRLTSNSVLTTHIFSIIDQCLATRMSMVGRPLGATRSGRHPLNITQGTVTLGETSGALAVTLLNMR